MVKTVANLKQAMMLCVQLRLAPQAWVYRVRRFAIKKRHVGQVECDVTVIALDGHWIQGCDETFAGIFEALSVTKVEVFPHPLLCR